MSRIYLTPMRICLSIMLAFSLTACEQKQETTESASPSKDIVLQHEGFRSAYASTLEAQSGIPAHLLPPYRYDSIREDGNHEYIYVLDDETRAQWAILIYSSPDAGEQTYQIFKETPTEDGVKRSPITDQELSTHLDIIERKLIEHYGEEMYRRHYTGGLPENEEEDSLLINTLDDDDMSLEMIEQRAAEALGEETLYNIAHLIHYLRATLQNK